MFSVYVDIFSLLLVMLVRKRQFLAHLLVETIQYVESKYNTWQTKKNRRLVGQGCIKSDKWHVHDGRESHEFGKKKRWKVKYSSMAPLSCSLFYLRREDWRTTTRKKNVSRTGSKVRSLKLCGICHKMRNQLHFSP